MADLFGRAGSSIIACSTCSHILGMLMASWYARVKNSWFMLLHPSTPQLKKKQVYGWFSTYSCPAVVCMNVVSLTPLWPWIKNTELHGLGSLIQHLIISFSFLHVPGKHLGGGYYAAESCRAPWEMTRFKACMPGIQSLVVWAWIEILRHTTAALYEIIIPIDI